MKGVSGKEWVLLSQSVIPDRGLVSRVGSIKAQLLANRKMDDSALQTKLKNLLPPYDIPNIQKAVEIIAEHVQERKRIVLFGDYDVDGITGTALLYDFLRKAGARVIPVLPSRKRGYGLTKELVYKLRRYADLLVTIDNGTTAVEELRNSGLKTLVVDHHNPGEELPEALLVNPKLGNGKLGELKEISSSGLVFYIATLLNKELGLGVDVRNYLHLACMGTVADVMPMNFLNRIIVFNGIRLLNFILKGGLRSPGVRLLMERSGIKDQVRSRDIAFSLAPKLNAPGRVAKPHLALKLLLEKDEVKARSLMEKIERLNNFRKQLSGVALEEALKQVREQQDRGMLIVKLEEWAGGVAGIVAGRLAGIFSKPAAVISVGKEYSSGSVRAPEGLNIYYPLKKLSHLFTKWGGHAQAAGFTIKTRNLESFEKLAGDVFSELHREEGKVYIDMELPLSDIGQEIYELLGELEPYGEGFPEPVFMSEPLELTTVKDTGDRLLMKAGEFMVLGWDRSLIRQITNLKGKRRIAYQIDHRRARTLILTDVEA